MAARNKRGRRRDQILKSSRGSREGRNKYLPASRGPAFSPNGVGSAEIKSRPRVDRRFGFGIARLRKSRGVGIERGATARNLLRCDPGVTLHSGLHNRWASKPLG